MSVDALLKAVKLRPEVAELHLNLGIALERAGRHDEALRCFKRASKLNSVPATLKLAEIAIDEGDADAGETHIRKALAQDPDSPLAYAHLGSCLSHKGDLEGSEEAFRSSISLNPNQGFSYLRLTLAKRVGEEAMDLVTQMEDVRDRGKLGPQELSSLLFALAKAYEDLGKYEKAMSSYDGAQRNAYLARYGDRVFDREAFSAFMQAIRNRFPSGEQNLGSDSDRPIFIVGMIRSGTSLVEQILSCHPDVAGGGELSFWKLHGVIPSAMSEIVADPGRAKSITQKYLAGLDRISEDARHVTDKLPANYQRLGLLQELLPNAKIIHCVRNPIDTALSIYTTPNREPSAGKGEVVFIYRRYEEMMKYWKQVLRPGSILDVRYEDLVSDAEPNIRRMLEFCGLPWNDVCLHPEKNTKSVFTPSLWQVRQPIYGSSVERWRRFEPWLGEFKELL